MEIDCVGHEGGDPRGDFAQTLTVTDIRLGWTETQAVKNKAQQWVFAALMDITELVPFPILGIDSDNGSEFINGHLLRYCQDQQITFTRSRVGNKNDGAHVEQKNWSVVRHAVGYHRYDTAAELALLNETTRCCGCRPTSSHASRSSSRRPATAPKSPSATTSPRPPTSGSWSKRASATKSRNGSSSSTRP